MSGQINELHGQQRIASGKQLGREDQSVSTVNWSSVTWQSWAPEEMLNSPKR